MQVQAKTESPQWSIKVKNYQRMSGAAEDANTTNNGSTKYRTKADSLKVIYVKSRKYHKKLFSIHSAKVYVESAVYVPYGNFKPFDVLDYFN